MGNGFVRALEDRSELEITVKGRRSKEEHSTPVWFVHEGSKVYLLPVKGSETNWYRNILRNPDMTLAAGRSSVRVQAKSITEPNLVQNVIKLFAAKYGGMDEINRWYSKLDVAVEIVLP